VERVDKGECEKERDFPKELPIGSPLKDMGNARRYPRDRTREDTCCTDVQRRRVFGKGLMVFSEGHTRKLKSSLRLYL